MCLQEIPWHVRWPVPHPPQPHPFVWLAKNNLFLDVSETPVE
jgi:hypothetical protein